MLAAFQAVGLVGLRRLDSAEILACTRIAKNMSAIGYTGAEIALLLRALYLSASRQDVREVWWLFDRRHVGQLPRHEVEDRLKEILGDEVAPLLHKELDKLTRDRHRGATSSDDGTIGMGTGMQRVGFAEFAKLLAALAHGRSSETIAYACAGKQCTRSRGGALPEACHPQKREPSRVAAHAHATHAPARRRQRYAGRIPCSTASCPCTRSSSPSHRDPGSYGRG